MAFDVLLRYRHETFYVWQIVVSKLWESQNILCHDHRERHDVKLSDLFPVGG